MRSPLVMEGVVPEDTRVVLIGYFAGSPERVLKA